MQCEEQKQLQRQQEEEGAEVGVGEEEEELVNWPCCYCCFYRAAAFVKSLLLAPVRPFIIPGIKASRSRRTSITAVTSCFSNQLLSKSQRRRRRSCDSLHSCPQPLFKMGLRGWGYCKKPYSKEAEMLDSKMKFNPGGRLTSLGVCCFLMKKMTRTKINYGFKSA